MKILVTGGAGFIGSHLSEKLASEGHRVTVLDSLSSFLYSSELKSRNIENFKQLGINFFRVDLNDPEVGNIVKGMDVVINQAAIPGLVKSWTHLDEYMNSNVVGLGNLLKACSRFKIRKFIQISTSSVYGYEATGNENSDLKPHSPYGVSKLAAEKLVIAYGANFDIPFTILRYFSVYGPRQRPDMAYQKFITSIIDDQPIVVFGDGSQTRTNTYVSDIVDGTISVINAGEISNGKTYNLSGLKSVTLTEAIKIIESINGKAARITFGPAKVGDQKNTEGNISLARKELGYFPGTDFLNGLEAQFVWNYNLRKS